MNLKDLFPGHPFFMDLCLISFLVFALLAVDDEGAFAVFQGCRLIKDSRRMAVEGKIAGADKLERLAGLGLG